MGTAAGRDLRLELRFTKLLLLFTPELVRGGDPQGLLDALLPLVDGVQVRVKPLGGAPGPCDARDSLRWCRRALQSARGLGRPPLVFVDDRVDVALALLEEGLAGVHLGEADLDPEAARALLGERPLIGLSTHGLAAIAAASERPVDYLGFGPVHATGTKGYGRGLGAEMAWIAAEASTLPVFAIGGIDVANAGELATVGRIAVGSAILSAKDPIGAVAALRAALMSA